MILRSQWPGQVNACLIFCCDPKEKRDSPAPEKSVAVSLAFGIQDRLLLPAFQCRSDSPAFANLCYPALL